MDFGRLILSSGPIGVKNPVFHYCSGESVILAHSVRLFPHGLIPLRDV
jgi:hypothetical protein